MAKLKYFCIKLMYLLNKIVSESVQEKVYISLTALVFACILTWEQPIVVRICTLICMGVPIWTEKVCHKRIEGTSFGISRFSRSKKLHILATKSIDLLEPYELNQKHKKQTSRTKQTEDMLKEKLRNDLDIVYEFIKCNQIEKLVLKTHSFFYMQLLGALQRDILLGFVYTQEDIDTIRNLNPGAEHKILSEKCCVTFQFLKECNILERAYVIPYKYWWKATGEQLNSNLLLRRRKYKITVEIKYDTRRSRLGLKYLERSKW